MVKKKEKYGPGYDWPEPIRSELIAEEKEREKRAKHRVRYCPVCGRKPEYTPEQAGRHIYSLKCEKCQLGCVIHVNE